MGHAAGSELKAQMDLGTMVSYNNQYNLSIYKLF